MNDLEYELMSCLIPLYLDEKTSKATNVFIEERLRDNPEYKELFDAMTAEIKLEPSISVKRKHRIGPCGKIAIFVAGYIAVAFIILYLAVLILTNGVL